MLNEEFYTFSRAIEADAAPTVPQMEVFKMLDGRLEEQLKAWAQIKNEDVPKINALIKQADIPALTVASASRRQDRLRCAPGATQCHRPSPPRRPRSNHEHGRAEARPYRRKRAASRWQLTIEIRMAKSEAKSKNMTRKDRVKKQPAFDRYRSFDETGVCFGIRILPVRR